MFTVGICGGTASGKTTLVGLLKEYFGENLAVVHCDNYYISRDDMSLAQRRRINYDSPESVDIERLMKDIHLLKNQQEIDQPIFSYKTFLRTEKTIKTKPAEILIVEGIFVLFFSQLRENLDLKVFLEVDAETRFARRILRDTREHERQIDFIVDQYLKMAKPMHNIYVEPYKKYADIILQFYENNQLDAARIVKQLITAGINES